LSKKRKIYTQFFGENIFKIITLVPGNRYVSLLASGAESLRKKLLANVEVESSKSGAGLPDFSWCIIPKLEKIPNEHKM
jgi:hypothetical protein